MIGGFGIDTSKLKWYDKLWLYPVVFLIIYIGGAWQAFVEGLDWLLDKLHRLFHKKGRPEKSFIQTNKEAELMGNNNNSWLLAYADGSEFYVPNALHVERNDELMLVEDDEQASKEAEKAGVPLIYNMESVPNDIYVDTKENREIIRKMLTLYPEYKNVHEKK